MPWYWGYSGLSENPSISPEFVEKHIDKPWHWGRYGLSSNPSISPEFVEKHIDKPWYWGRYGLSNNPSISPEFIEKYIDKPWEWGWRGLSSNPFTSEIKKEARESAARVIQIKFLDWFYKPICKDGTYGLNCLLAEKMCS
jgi:hypothetical protein